MIPPAESAGEGHCLANAGREGGVKAPSTVPKGRGDVKVKVLVAQLRPHGL